MILWRTYDKCGKNTGFCENFMSTETFTFKWVTVLNEKPVIDEIHGLGMDVI